jgi:D-tyrosyl-tRNA(Tyr) deacylase
MRAVVQRVTKCSVSIDGNVIGTIGKGLLVLLGIATGDSEKDADYLSEKIVNLRIFEDESGKMNLSVLETGGQILVVSQFTLLGDCRKGRRPSFFKAADPQKAEIRYQYFVQKVRESGITVQTGQFQALMEVSLVNYGPVTLILES